MERRGEEMSSALVIGNWNECVKLIRGTVEREWIGSFWLRDIGDDADCHGIDLLGECDGGVSVHLSTMLEWATSGSLNIS